MQTVDHSPISQSGPAPVRRLTLRDMRQVTVTPVVPRHSAVPTRETLQAAEDGGEAEAHPS